ncbi:M1 family metallopeptidase [Psychroflexus aestuariivivens]|uniref:M1 family metallopeptidase n=1 Tax=Psychroflexus aestuariivivens TaxID=1795040 RepID=UPI000FDC77C4|nr:M1 family metallopeptidase [Psychroflexus aestuariivivens]
MKRIYIFIFIFCPLLTIHAQLLGEKQEQFTKADTLRGSLRPERTSFDVLSYGLDIKINPEKRNIIGFNDIKFKVVEDTKKIQIDLFENMNVDSIVFNSKHLKYNRKHNAVFIDFPEKLQKNNIETIRFYYSGQPIVAKNPPWDGGFVFSKDKNGKPWIGVAVQGTGASLWYPNKDHLSDEPDQADIKVSVPNGLMNVSNGRLIEEIPMKNGYTKWHWRVENSINNYNITVNIGDYTHFEDSFQDLEMDYYVMKYNLEKAKSQFQQVQGMMQCFYEKFGEYPFEKDGFKLVETPYLGMEHQSAVAYGNGYQNGYAGTDLSHTGVGKKWDFIIIHESAHEWFGNSISVADIADLWIHEGFTSYAESVYVECEFGKKDAINYLYGLRSQVSNREPIIGNYGVNDEGSSDMYYKGANMLNTIRSIVNNDEVWWSVLKKFYQNFKHSITNTEAVIQFFDKNIDYKLKPIFQQYLYHTTLPKLQLKFTDDEKLFMRWETDVKNFEMPVEFKNSNKAELKRTDINSEWTEIDIELENIKDLAINKFGFYIDVELVTNN